MVAIFRSPVAHPLTHPVTTLTTDQVARNHGSTSAVREATVRDPSFNFLSPALGATWRTP